MSANKMHAEEVDIDISLVQRYALSQALIFIPYYLNTNPVESDMPDMRSRKFFRILEASYNCMYRYATSNSTRRYF
jgi:hypothetical protein